jgi:hypothetical protein
MTRRMLERRVVGDGGTRSHAIEGREPQRCGSVPPTPGTFAESERGVHPHPTSEGAVREAGDLPARLRAALTPVVTMFGLDLAGVLAGSFITETIFNLPGIGQYAVTSIFRNDFPSVMGVTIFGAFFIAIANLCVDIVYAYVDPRVRFA